MGFFPLPLTAEVQRESVTTPDRSGQELKSWATFATPNCMFMTNNGSQITNIREEFKEVAAFYTTVDVDIKEGDRIINVRDRDGNIMAPGPYFVQNVKIFAGLGGRPHHKSVKIAGKTHG